jgi:S-adenosylhomocysteine hydrolase
MVAEFNPICALPAIEDYQVTTMDDARCAGRPLRNCDR